LSDIMFIGGWSQTNKINSSIISGSCPIHSQCPRSHAPGQDTPSFTALESRILTFKKFLCSSRRSCKSAIFSTTNWSLWLIFKERNKSFY
jgi:hypothetical protein